MKITRVLQYEEIQEKIEDNDLEIKVALEELMAMITIVEPRESYNVIKEDPDDNKIIECAVAGNADYIVTQDNHLLKLKEFQGIKIVKPEELIKII